LGSRPPYRIQGAEFRHILEHVSEKEPVPESPWFLKEAQKPLSDAQLRRYINRADKQFADDLSSSRKINVGRHIAVRRHLYTQALARGDLRTVLAAANSEAKLLGLAPATGVEVTGSVQARVSLFKNGSGRTERGQVLFQNESKPLPFIFRGSEDPSFQIVSKCLVQAIDKSPAPNHNINHAVTRSYLRRQGMTSHSPTPRDFDLELRDLEVQHKKQELDSKKQELDAKKQELDAKKTRDLDRELKDLEVQDKKQALDAKKQEFDAKKTRDLDRELKNVEIQLKKQERDAKNRCLAQWNSPVVLAILAALFGYLSTLFTWYLAQRDEQARYTRTLDLEKVKQQATETLEKQKQQATETLEKQKLHGMLILDALRTGEGSEKAKRAAANLLLLDDAKLVSFDEATKQRLRNRAENVGAGLPVPGQPARPEPLDEKAYSKIRDDAGFAVSVLNPLFGKQFTSPEVKPTEIPPPGANFNRFTMAIHAQPEVQYLPDITYRLVAHMYLPNWTPSDQSAELSYSLADVLASYVKQRRRNQSAKEADWEIAPKGVAWIRGRDLATTQDTTPLRSLKAPGKAYDDMVIGKDPQVDHMKRYVKTSEDGSAIRINSGIPSKAFYEAAMQIGTDKATTAWVKAIGAVGAQPTFTEFARETVKQAEALHGRADSKAVQEAWKAVGVEPAK
jgi:hypothetical protein